MTRTPQDWREHGLSNVDGTVEGLGEEISEYQNAILEKASALRAAAHEDNPSRDDLKERTDALTETLIDLAHTSFDLAADVHGLKSGATFRNLQGKEPAGYSKRDGGATHDAYYGMQSMNKNFARQVSWPLQLDDWDKERADSNPRDGVLEPVEAEGTHKYTKTIGGRTVHVVIDERGMSPI